jgi:hypothetical protein
MHLKVADKTTAVMPSPQQSALISSELFSHVQVTILPLARPTSTDARLQR